MWGWWNEEALEQGWNEQWQGTGVAQEAPEGQIAPLPSSPNI